MVKAVYILCILFLLVSCTSLTPTQKEIQLVVTEINSSNEETVNDVEDLVDLGPEAIPDLLTTVEQEELNAKWAGIYALSRIGYDQDIETRQQITEQLKQEFTNDALSIRVMSGGVVTIFGDKEGIPVLIESLDNEEFLYLTEPPQKICDYVYEVLSHYTQQSLGASCTVEAKLAYQSWWDQNNDALSWDDEAKVYNT